MPELKRNFIKGRMNRDLDERLVPNGEYRLGENIGMPFEFDGAFGEIATTQGNRSLFWDTGNRHADFEIPVSNNATTYPNQKSTCVGSIVDEKNVDAYWFVAGPKFPRWPYITVLSGDLYMPEIPAPGEPTPYRDMIVEYHGTGPFPWPASGINPVWVDVPKVCLPIGEGYAGLVNQISFQVPTHIQVGMSVYGVLVAGFPSGPWTVTQDTLPSNLLVEIVDVNGLPGLIQFNQYFDSAAANYLIFTQKPSLKFNKDRLITAINIVDDMLLWTDNHSEPKKINIPRGKAGTNTNGWHHTDIMVEGVNKGGHHERHITNIRKAPLSPPILKMSNIKDRIHPITGETLPITTFQSNYAWSGSLDGGTTTVLYPVGTTSNDANIPANAGILGQFSGNAAFYVGDILLCTNDPDADPDTFTDHQVKLLVVPGLQTVDPNNPVPQSFFDVEILDIDPTLDMNNPVTWYIRLESGEPLYELKFPKFSYRYKYEDGEYSTFAPFSEIAFIPKDFEYHPKEGFNLGMVNDLRSLIIKDFVPKDIPEDVIEVDLLYKESDSPNIYTVKTFKSTDPEWLAGGTGSNKGVFSIESDLIHAVVSSNQFLRPWDNVPRKALAQEITGNRVVYGNYVQNYNMSLYSGGPRITPNFNVFHKSYDVTLNEPKKSLKSIRTYQLGVVYKDFYGRETPVFSHNSGVVRTNKTTANKSNKLFAQINTNPPSWADSFKYFLKETSNEYYNLAMDRWYDAGDENIWLSFPSEDRNKVDLETTILLKKGDDEDGFVEEVPRYKILAIENEAPDYIKTTRVSMGYMDMETGTAGTLDGNFYPGTGNGDGFPLLDRRNIKIKANKWEISNLSSLQNRQNTILEGGLTDKSMGLQLRILDGPPTKADSSGAPIADRPTKWYNVSNISANPQETISGGVSIPPDSYTITIEEPETGSGFINDVLFLTGGTDNPANIITSPSIWIEICKWSLENKAEFDGRFFVKILKDGSIKNHIQGTQVSLTTQSSWEVDETIYPVYLDGPPTQPSQYNASGSFGQGPFQFLPAQGVDLETQVFTKFGTTGTWTDRLGIGDYWIPRTPYLPPTSNEGQGSANPCSGVGVFNPATGAGAGGSMARYLGASPHQIMMANAASGNHFYGWVLYWQNDETGDNPNLATANAWWPAMQPETHRYPGSLLGNSSDEIDCQSQALLPLPYRARTEWESLGYTGWFIDSEPLVMRLSRSGEHGGKDVDSDDNAELYLVQTIGADVGQDVIDISFIGFKNIDATTFGEFPWHFLNQADEDIATLLQAPNTVFRFTNDSYDEIAYEIKHCDILKGYNYDCYGADAAGNLNKIDPSLGQTPFDDFYIGPYLQRQIYRLTLVDPFDHATPKPIGTGADIANNGLGQPYSPIRDQNATQFTTTGEASETQSVGIEFLSPYNGFQRTTIPAHPAIWETEPKEDIGLDIYYEASDTLPVAMDSFSDERYIPIKSNVSGGNISNMVSVDEEIEINEPFVSYTNYTRPNIFIDSIDISRLSTSGVFGPGANIGNQGIPDILGPPNVLLSLLWGGYPETSWPPPGAGTFKLGMYVYGDIAWRNIFGSGIKRNQFLGICEKVDAAHVNLNGPFNGHWDGTVGAPYIWPGVANITLGTVAIPPNTNLLFTNKVKVLDISGQTGIYELATGYYGTELILGGYVKPSITPLISTGDILTFTDSDSSSTSVALSNSLDTYTNPAGSMLYAPGDSSSGTYLDVSSLAHGKEQSLSFFNCYSFGNGVESNRIRDLYNAVTIDKGVKASTTLAEQYQEERRSSGLIFSGIYNSKMKGVNRLNQFIQAENITKDLNPEYGSIQKLHQRDTDLITLCEDKILKILANKDALFNADGTKNLTATSKVLGQAQPFIGEYGISQNPESFASEAFRAYFTDRNRGAVLRLSKDGLTAISSHGLTTHFRDMLDRQKNLVGSYDARDDFYNISFDYLQYFNNERTTGWFPWGLQYATASFSEKTKGWVTFKSFQPETAFSMGNYYFSTKHGELWVHDQGQVNSFYQWGCDDAGGVTHTQGASGLCDAYDVWKPLQSSITFTFNDNPDTIKSFTTLSYEGTQARTIQNITGNPSMYGTVSNPWDGQYYNNLGKEGWYVNSIKTDQQTGTVKEFVEKEGKWFSYIHGEPTVYSSNIDHNIDTKEFSVQGIANVSGFNCCQCFPWPPPAMPPLPNSQIIGCTDPTAVNFDPLANCNDCQPPTVFPLPITQQVGGPGWIDCCCFEEGVLYISGLDSNSDPIYSHCCPTGMTWDNSLEVCV